MTSTIGEKKRIHLVHQSTGRIGTSLISTCNYFAYEKYDNLPFNRKALSLRVFPDVSSKPDIHNQVEVGGAFSSSLLGKVRFNLQIQPY